MMYAFIDEHRDEFPVVKMADMLGVSRSGYYRRRKEPLTKRERSDQAKSSLFRYIELFYNRKRRHSKCGWISPEQYERNYWSSKLEVAA